MVAPNTAAQASPSGEMSQPTVAPSACIHPYAQLVGNVRIEANALVAPGVSIRAELEGPFRIGADSALQGGVMIQALKDGRVLGDDQHAYAVWIGSRVGVMHKALIHGPVYIGDECFIGFRSTIFNARLGRGCVIMMHALVQDVEIPPGKFVPSGMVVTHQEQADRLPNVSPADRAIAQELSSVNDSLRTSYSRVENGVARPSSPRVPDDSTQTSSHDNESITMQPQRLTPEIVQQVRQLLNQGYRIGTEHADSRRYRSGVWKTCPPIESTREAEVLSALEACLAEHAGEYVRLFGIDPVAKRRGAPMTIQRPDGKPIEPPKSTTYSGRSPSASASGSDRAHGSLSAEVVQQVRQLLNQGYHIGTEHADSRRYRSGVWKTCAPIRSTRESEVLPALEGCLADHAGEYVRLFGIDPAANRRVAPVTIQRPDSQPVAPSQPLSQGSSSAPSASPSSGYNGQADGQGGLSPEVTRQVKQLVQQGYRVGAEYADARRFRSGVWKTCESIQTTRVSEALSALKTCLQQHAGEYVRIFGIDPTVKRRLDPIIVQRPEHTPPQAAATAAAGNRKPASTPAQNGHQPPQGGHGVSQDIAQQVQQLVAQGYRISLEHADSRRYRSGTWQNGGVLEGNTPGNVLAALEAQLQAHSGEYVRLVGIDPQAKRRVLETTIQRP